MASIWISRVDLEELVGVDATQKLLTAFPGRSVYIPRRSGAGLAVETAVGGAAFETLQAEFAGCEILLPSTAVKAPSLKSRIIPMLEAGLSYREIVNELQCTLRHVCGVAADMGLTKRPRWKRRQDASSEAGPSA